jgi:hypothetical protein
MADYYAIPQPHRERRRPTGAGDCQIGRWFVGHNVLMSFCWRLQMFGQSTQFIRICRRNPASASQCACCGRSDVYGLFCIHLSADIYTKWRSRSSCATAFEPKAGWASPCLPPGKTKTGTPGISSCPGVPVWHSSAVIARVLPLPGTARSRTSRRLSWSR